EELSWAASWYDQNADGRGDLYLATDTLERDIFGAPEWSEDRRSGESDRLHRSGGVDEAGRPLFEEVARDVRLDVPRSSMGGLVADLGGHLALDLFGSGFGRNHALSSAPDGTFRYRTGELGLERWRRGDGPHCPDDP